MTAWLARRIGQALLVIVAMTLVVFIGLHAIGNPADILIGEDLNQHERLEAIARLGLDRPLWQQYLAFVEGALRGHLGRSFVYQEDAVRLILQRLPATLELAVSALVMAVVVGVPLGEAQERVHDATKRAAVEVRVGVEQGREPYLA